MKSIQYKYLLFILLPFITYANPIKHKIEKEKVFHKTFDVGNTGSVVINNTYGSVNISTWKENTVDIKVTLIVNGNYMDEINQKLNNIKINFFDTGNTVGARTSVTNKSSWSIKNIFSKNKSSTHFRINYEVKMPIQHDLKLNNTYGNVYIDQLTGRLIMTVKYGEVEIGRLDNSNNNIVMDYIRSADFNYINKAKIVSNYGRININSAYQLQTLCDYVHLHINKVRKLNFKNDYGSINVANGTDIIGSGDYQKRYFSKIHSLKLTTDYGSVNIDNLLPNFSNINITGDYLHVSVFNNLNVPYVINVKQSYGRLSYNLLEQTQYINDNFDKALNAFYLDNNTSSSIKIVIDYGSIKINNKSSKK